MLFLHSYPLMCISEASVSRVLGDMRNVRQGRSGGQGDASGEGRVGCEGHRTGQGLRVPQIIAACRRILLQGMPLSFSPFLKF